MSRDHGGRGRLNDLEGLAACACVGLDDGVQTHDLEERLGVHALRAREVGAGLLERRHRCADAVHGRDAAHKGEDWLRSALASLLLGIRAARTH